MFTHSHYRPLNKPENIAKALFAIILPFVALGGQSNDSARPVYRSVDEVVTLGLESNPRLQADRIRWEGSIAEVPAHGALPEPSLKYNHYLESVETRVGPQLGAIGLSQKLPWFGKLRTDRQIADAQTRVYHQRYRATAQNVGAEIERIYWDYQYLQRAIEITSENLGLLRNWEKVSLSKYTTSQTGHPDVIKAQIEVLRLEDQLATLNQRQRPLLQKLSATVGIEIRRDDIDIVDFPAPVEPPPFDSLATMILQTNPDYLSSAALVRLQEKVVRRSKLNYLPDFTVNGSYIITGENTMPGAGNNDNGKDPLIVGLGISLPIKVKKYSALRQSAVAKHKSAVLLSKDTANILASKLELLLFDLDDTSRKIRLYEQALLPRAEQSLVASERAYIADQVDFLTLTESQRVLLNFQLTYQKALADYAIYSAQLNALLGTYTVVLSTMEN